MHSTKPDGRHQLLQRAPEAALILITLVWGGTFLLVQYALTLSSPLFFVGCRFAAAALAIGCLSLRHLRGMTLQDVWAGSCIGLAIALGYGLQTIGLQSITTSESAFLTALYVPVVPLLQWLVWGHRPHLMIWLGVVLAFVGLLLLTGQGWALPVLSFGQLATLLCAVAIAVEILLISHFASRVHVRRVTVIQLLAASVFAFALMPVAGETGLPDFSWQLFAVVAGLGIASALIQFTMNWAQCSVDAARATIIYAGEPVWAGIFGRIAGERLSLMALLGGALVVLGMLVSQWQKPRSAQDKNQS